jgi:hypothetical protein
MVFSLNLRLEPLSCLYHKPKPSSTGNDPLSATSKLSCKRKGQHLKHTKGLSPQPSNANNTKTNQEIPGPVELAQQ